MLQVYNTLSRKKEEFKPIKDRKVSMYVCGPTVYGSSHLGHARTYVIFDFIRRFFEFLDYKVKFIMNITDIHDDILKEARLLKIQPQKLAEKYSEEFFEDLKILKIKNAFKNPRVSAHIKEIIKIIEILLKKNCAYETEDGVYFRVSCLKNYGGLSGRKIEQAITGTRVKTDKYQKEEIVDFALWKKTQTNVDLTQTNADNKSHTDANQNGVANDEELFNSPWGDGRPGWHIECSAMSKKYLGIPFDIHGGAMDLIFPHHENEIAQSESAFNKKYVNYFLHSGLLYVNGQKMSKSLGNFITIKDFLNSRAKIVADYKINFQPTARFLRFFILSHHWRTVLDFNTKTLNNAWNNYVVINEFITKIQDTKNKKQSGIEVDFENFKEKFIYFLKDDFNSAGAINYLLEFINKTQSESGAELLKALKEFDLFFACLFPWKKIDLEVKNLIKQREEFRKNNQYEKADEIRKQLQKQNIILQDSKNGTLIVNLN